MLDEKIFKKMLFDTVQKILFEKISVNQVQKIVQNELESNDIWECSNILITDCYFALKHIQEEEISKKEWEYFMECLNDSKKYNLEEKLQLLS